MSEHLEFRLRLERSLQFIIISHEYKFFFTDFSVFFFVRYNAVFGTALELEDVKDGKLEDETALVLDFDEELNNNAVSLKTEKLAHVSQQFLLTSLDD